MPRSKSMSVPTTSNVRTLNCCSDMEGSLAWDGDSLGIRGGACVPSPPRPAADDGVYVAPVGTMLRDADLPEGSASRVQAPVPSARTRAAYCSGVMPHALLKWRDRWLWS